MMLSPTAADCVPTTPQLIIMLPIARAKVVQISFGTPLFISSYRRNQYSDGGGQGHNYF